MIVPRAAVLLLAIACACGTPAPPPRPAAPPPSADALLAQVAQAYQAAGSYVDRGTVTSRGATKSFTTAFVRPDQFRFELREDGDAQRAYLIWLADGAAYTDWYLRPESVVEDGSLEVALDAAAGVSSGASTLVPSLLLSTSHRLLSTLHDARITGEQQVGTRPCWRVEATQRVPGSTRTVVLLIDQESYAIRRLVHDSIHRIDYEPRLDVDIHPDELRGRTLAGANVKPRSAPRWIGVFFERGSTRLKQVFHVGPAAQVGMRAGDRIVRFAGKPVSKPSHVIRAINARGAGETVEVVIERDGAQLALSITIGERPETDALQREQLLGRPAPALELATLDGGRVSLSALRGQVIILDFWATWCAPCRAALPQLLRWQQQLGPKGLTIVGITEEDPATVTPFAQQHQMTYTIALDPPQDAWRSFLVTGLPTTIIIDRTGVVRRVAVGLADVSSIEATLVDLLK